MQAMAARVVVFLGLFMLFFLCSLTKQDLCRGTWATMSARVMERRVQLHASGDTDLIRGQPVFKKVCDLLRIPGIHGEMLLARPRKGPGAQLVGTMRPAIWRVVRPTELAAEKGPLNVRFGHTYAPSSLLPTRVS